MIRYALAALVFGLFFMCEVKIQYVPPGCVTIGGVMKIAGDCR